MASIFEVARENRFEYSEFKRFIMELHPEYLAWGEDLKRDCVDQAVNRFREEHLNLDQIVEEQKKKEEEAKRKREIREEEAKRKREIREKEVAALLPSVLISSGFSFEGYRITKYSGYISGDDTVQINRADVCDNNSEVICDALVKIRAQALKELKEAALALDCNAVIGVDFDYMTLEPERPNLSGGTTYYPYLICVTANGNAVKIEKE